jgi:hypothetical protein
MCADLSNFLNRMPLCCVEGRSVLLVMLVLVQVCTTTPSVAATELQVENGEPDIIPPELLADVQLVGCPPSPPPPPPPLSGTLTFAEQ